MDAMQIRNSSISGFRGAEHQRAIGYLALFELRASGTAGGTFTSGAWQVRALSVASPNHIPDAITAALPLVTLPRGVYDVFAQAPAWGVNRHVLQLWDVTNGAALLSGVSGFAAAAVGNYIMSQTNSFIIGRIYLSGATQLRLEHRCQTTKATDGFGLAMGVSFAVVTEVYATLEFWKVG